MHYYVAVLFDKTPTEDEVADALEPFNEDPREPIEYDCPLSDDSIEYKLSRDPDNFAALFEKDYPEDPEVKWNPEKGLYQTWEGAPNGKWDWWSVGGRWDPITEDKEGEVGSIERNALPVSDFLEKEIVPAAVVVGGEWLGDSGYANVPRNRIGQWDFAKIDKENTEEVLRVLAENKDKIVVGVDCHR